MKFLLAVLTLSALSLLPDSASAAASASGSASAPRKTCEAQPRKSATAAGMRIAKLTQSALLKLGIEVIPSRAGATLGGDYEMMCGSTDLAKCYYEYYASHIETTKGTKLGFSFKERGGRPVADVYLLQPEPVYDAEGNINFCQMVLETFTLTGVINLRTGKVIDVGPFTIPRQVLYRY